MLRNFHAIKYFGKSKKYKEMVDEYIAVINFFLNFSFMREHSSSAQVNCDIVRGKCMFNFQKRIRIYGKTHSIIIFLKS